MPTPTPTDPTFEDKVVLIVDDDPAIREFLVDLLAEEYGCSVISAPDARTALQTLALSRVDLVVLDLLLPDMSGFDVHKCLRTTPRTRYTPVLFITAANSEADFLRRGIVEYMIKPFDLDAFLRRTQRLLATSYQSYRKERLLQKHAHLELGAG